MKTKDHSPTTQSLRIVWYVTFSLAMLTVPPSWAFQFPNQNNNPEPESQLSEEINLIENNGFEMGMALPFTAGALNGSLSLTNNPMNVHGGAYALVYTSSADNGYTSPWNGSGLQVYQDDTTYRFSAWVKAAEPETRVRLFLFSKQNNQTSAPYWTGQSFTIGTEWEQINITHYSPPGYDQVAIRLDNRDAGKTVYWDDLALSPVTNLFPNPGFENQTLHFTGAARGTISIDTGQAHTGTSSLLHEATGDDSYTTPYRYLGSELKEVYPGDKFTFSAWARADVNTTIELRILALTRFYQPLEIQTGTFTATPNWRKFSIDFEMPSQAKYVTVRLDNDGGTGSKVWWDDLILEQHIPDNSTKISFMTPVHRTLKPGDQVYMAQLHQRGRNGLFSFEIPGNAVDLQWIQTQGPIRVDLGPPNPSENGFTFTGAVEFVESGNVRSLAESSHDFTAELQFEVDGECVSFFVNGTFAFANFSMFVEGSNFDIQLSDFPTQHQFNLIIDNFASEDLIIPIFDLYESVFDQPFGIETQFIPTGVQDPDGIDPNGVVLVPPFGSESIPITLIENFGADSGPYDATFTAIPRNGFSDFADLRGMFRRTGDDLSIENIRVEAVPGGSVPNNGIHTIAEPLQASGEALAFDIRNFNPEDVLVEEPSIQVFSAPEGSNLDFVLDGSSSGIIGGNGGFGGFSGTLTYDEANTQNGNFSIDVTLTFTDVNGGFNFTDFYVFTINGAIGVGNPCDPAKRADDPVCDGPLYIEFADHQPISTTEPNPVGTFRLEYLDFDNIDILLNIQNISEGLCVVQNGTVTGNGYSIAPGQFPFNLQPQDVAQKAVHLNMANLQAGNHAGMVTLTHDDGTTIDFTLTSEIKPFLGIRVFDDSDREIALSTDQGTNRGVYNFTPDGPMSIDEGRRFKIFSIRNTGTNPVVFKTGDADIDQQPKDNTEAFGFTLPSGDVTIPPNGSVSIGFEFVSDSNSPFHVGVFDGTVIFPFEVMGAETDSATLSFGLTGEIGTPAELEVEACPLGQVCFAGGEVFQQSPVGTVGFSPSTLGKNFKLVNRGEQPVVIDEIIINVAADEFTFELPMGAAYGMPLRDWPDKDFSITFTPPPGSDEDDTFFGDITIKYNPEAHPNLGDFVIGITAQGGDVEIQNQGNFVPQGGSIAFAGTSQTPGGTASEEVAIMNLGNTSLTGTASLTQIQGNAFSLDPGGTLLNLSVSPGSQQTFNVVLDRSVAGTFAAEISVNHNLPGPDPYTFTVSATVGGGTGGNGNFRVTHGPSTPVNHNSTFDFGQTPVGVFIGKNFRIWNDGNTPLVLPRANFTVPAGYQLIGTPDGPIPPPDPDGTVHWDNFSVHLKADQAGQFNGAIQIVNDSGHNPNPYTINVTGTVGSQDPGPTGVRVTHGATEVPHLSLFSFGTTEEGVFIGKNFRIWNETSEPLTFPRALFTVPAGYQLIETPDGPIPPPDPDGTVHWDNFSVHLTANNHGTFNGQVSFVPQRANGTDLPTYRINVTGNVSQDPACLNDVTGPSLTVTTPENNEVLQPGTATIRAMASDTNGVERVKFFVDNQVINNDTSQPYSANWNATPGTHTIRVEAYDFCDNPTQKVLSVTVQDPCDLDSQGPTVTITNPADGAELDPDLIEITATASDASGVTHVEFYVDGTLVGDDTEAPWTHSHWFTTEGQHTVLVTAYDGCDNTGSDSVTFQITQSGAPCDDDNVAPSGSITSPANGAVIDPGNTTITANATDNVEVFAVTFEIDGQVPAGAVDLSPPYAFVWNATPGTHTIRLRIADVCDNIGYSSTISVTVNGADPCDFDNTGPSAGITNPANGAVLEPGLINITASASDPSGVAHVEFYVNGSLKRDDTEAPWTHGHWFTIEGQQTVQIIAYDGCGNTTSDTVTFQITESGAPCDGDNILPWGSVTSPANGAVINPGNITLTATASDNVNVFAVSFEIDGQVPADAVDLAPPYAYVWNATPGSHNVRIRILDVCDNIGYSDSIAFTVNSPDPCDSDHTAPTVNITVPQDGVDVEPGLIDITATANDNAGGSGMDRVEFYVNGSLKRTDTAPPWTHGHWFTIEGQQTVQVIAYDQCGNSSTDTVTFTVTESGAPCDGDTQPPTGAYTNQTPNSVIMPGPITLTANVTDNVNVFAVSFVVDGQVPEANVDLAPPYQYTWNATPGVHTLSLNMLDSCDNSGQSPTISITVLGSTPTTVPNFVGRINGQNLNGLVVNQTNPTIDFTWDHASAAPGIERYHIVVQPIGGPWLYGPNILYPGTSHSLQTSGLVPGTSYSIHIRAKSNDGIWGNFVNGGSFTVQ